MKHKKLKLFLDANIFFAGSASIKGGSALILEACQNQVFQAVTTKLVLQESKKNIIKKLQKQQLERFLKHIKKAKLPLKIATPKEFIVSVVR